MRVGVVAEKDVSGSDHGSSVAVPRALPWSLVNGDAGELSSQVAAPQPVISPVGILEMIIAGKDRHALVAAGFSEHLAITYSQLI